MGVSLAVSPPVDAQVAPLQSPAIPPAHERGERFRGRAVRSQDRGAFVNMGLLAAAGGGLSIAYVYTSLSPSAWYEHAGVGALYALAGGAIAAGVAMQLVAFRGFPDSLFASRALLFTTGLGILGGSVAGMALMYANFHDLAWYEHVGAGVLYTIAGFNALTGVALLGAGLFAPPDTFGAMRAALPPRGVGFGVGPSMAGGVVGSATFTF